jgi:GNAT superfamily N-acetyltransferase
MPANRPPLDIHNVVIRTLADTDGFADFTCGVSEIDDWCRSKAADSDRRHKSRVFCATLNDSRQVSGFYSLSVRGSDAKHVGAEIARDFNESGFVPFVYIDYLAVRRELHRRQLGTIILMDALHRCSGLIRNMGCAGIALNSLTPQATAWYESFGFRRRQRGMAQFPLMILPAQSLLDLSDDILRS